MNEDRKQKKKGIPAWLWVIIIAYIVIMAVKDEGFFDFDWLMGVFTIAGVVIAIAGFLAALRVARAVKRTNAGPERAAFRGQRRDRSGRIPHRRDRQIEDRPLPVPQRSFSPAVYDENPREDSSRQDRERRLRQLEDFYKNGIIEKEEYLLLKNRYSKS